MKDKIALCLFLMLSINWASASFQSQQLDSLLQAHPRATADSLIMDSIKLEEVVVKGRKEPFKWDKKGGLMADVRHSDLRNEVDMNSVLRRIPGLWMRNGQIEIPGKQAPVYYINNRKVQQLYEVEMLSVKDIDEIQVLISPGLEYESEGAPVILIKTQNPFEGITVQINPSLSYAKEWGDRESVNLTYHNKKNLDVFFMYRHSNIYHQQESNYQQTNWSDTIWQRNNTDFNTQRTYSHIFQTGFNYRFKSSVFGLKYDTSLGEDSDPSFSSFVLANNQQTGNILSGNMLRETNSNRKYHHVNLFASHTIADRWKLKLTADYVYQHNNAGTHSAELLPNESSTLSYQMDSKWHIFAGQVMATYTHTPFGELSIGSNISSVNGHNGTNYTHLQRETRTQMKENKYSLFLSYNCTFGNLNLTAGVRYEWLMARSKDKENKLLKEENYPNWKPSLSLSYSTDAGIMHLLNYSLAVRRPQYDDLNNDIRYMNRFSYVQGNLNLTSSSEHTFNYTFYWKHLFTNITYAYMHNHLFSETNIYPDKSYATIQRAINGKDNQTLIINANYRYPIKFWEPSLNFLCYKTFYNYEFNSQKRHAGMPLLSLSFSNLLSLPHNFRLTLEYQHNFKGDAYYMKSRAYSSLNIELQKVFLKDKIQCNLNLNDVFHKQRTHLTAYFNQVMLHSRSHSNSCKINLSVIYRFNQSLSKHKYEGENAANEEIGRLNNVEKE